MTINARRIRTALICTTMLLVATPLASSPTKHASSDQWYLNPILAGDWSDPDPIRVGEDFYMTASSLANVPGLPILHSKDLVHWTIIGHALEKLEPEGHFRTPRKGGGVWAPSIRFHDGLFRIYYPDPDYGIFLVTAKNPAGPWSAPTLVDASRGAIDPTPFWDEDGSGWLVHGWARSRAGFANRLTLKRLAPDGRRTIGAGITIIDGETLPPVATSIGTVPWGTVEGPKLYKRNGYYYVFAPAGGVKPGWQAVFRSRSLTGPYEGRDVLDQGATAVNGPHQGAWVDTGTGEDWFLHFQDTDSYGRRVHLQPMVWRDDWPVIGRDADGDGRGEPVSCHRAPRTLARSLETVQASDAFSLPRLSPAWQWSSNPAADWASLSARPGWLRLSAVPGSANAYENGAILVQKLPALAFDATAKIEFAPLRVGEAAGLGLFGDSYGWIGLEHDSDGDRLVQRRRDEANSGGAEVVVSRPWQSTKVWLRVSVRPRIVAIPPPPEDAPWPSKARRYIAETRFSYSMDGVRYEPLGEPFMARQGRWVGAQLGIFGLARSGTPAFAATSNGHVDVDSFEVATTETASDAHERSACGSGRGQRR